MMKSLAALYVWITCLSTWLLSGCTSTSNINVNLPAEQAGYLIVSVKTNLPSVATDIKLLMRDTKTLGNAELKLPDYRGGAFLPFTNFPRSVRANNIKHLFVQKLPPGNYELYDYSFAVPRLRVRSEYSLLNKGSVPFSILRGEAVYLGEIELMAPTTNGEWIQPETLTDIGIKINDLADADIATASRRHPEILGLPIALAVPGKPKDTAKVRKADQDARKQQSTEQTLVPATSQERR